MKDDAAADFMCRVQHVLQLAYLRGHDSIVLAAWGTDSGCPVEHVATLFADSLYAYAALFRHISFAIVDSATAAVFRCVLLKDQKQT